MYGDYMKKLNKKVVIIVISLLVLILGSVIFLSVSKDKSYSLTLTENRWIDSNKYNVVDISLLNEIPAIAYEGKGVAYDYFEYLEKTYGIKINVVPYKLDENSEAANKTVIKSKISSNDLALLKSNMILLTKDNKKYNSISDITNLTIGIVKDDKDEVSTYLNNDSINYVEYNNYTDLKNALLNDNNKGVNSIVILKSFITREIIEKDLVVGYDFSDLSKYITISISEDKTLKSILSKTYNKWSKNNYTEKYNSYLLDNYFEFKNITELDQRNLKSKSYVYGFIDDGIYNKLHGNEITGINALVLKGFNEFSNVAITYVKYNSISKIRNDYNSGKVDFVFSSLGITSNNDFNTVGIFNKQMVVVSNVANNVVVSSLKSLKNKDVSVIKDSAIEKELISLGIKVKAYNNMNDLIKGFSEKDILIMDLENYNYYKSSKFKDCKIDFIENTADFYNFTINDNDSNKIFKSLFNFYLNYSDMNEMLSTNYESIAYENSNIVLILIIIIIILLLYVGIDSYNHAKVMFKNVKKNRKTHFTKEEKLKYIDQLTSLKNRAYLNSKIEEWDESEVYPQAIIIIDLNNVSYVNDNYGREEGDKIIAEAANVLIQNQLQNSEIIRSDGNEFLIYLVGYTEKQIIAYLRKLNRQLKGISRGFGCASGYSIITDAIKTIDDAVNEATIDMKNNKEEIDY